MLMHVILSVLQYFLKTHKANKHGIYSMDTPVTCGSNTGNGGGAVSVPSSMPSSGAYPTTPTPTSAAAAAAAFFPAGLTSNASSAAALQMQHLLQQATTGSQVMSDGGLTAVALAARAGGMINLESYCEICQKEFCNKYFLKVSVALYLLIELSKLTMRISILCARRNTSKRFTASTKARTRRLATIARHRARRVRPSRRPAARRAWSWCARSASKSSAACCSCKRTSSPSMACRRRRRCKACSLVNNCSKQWPHFKPKRQVTSAVVSCRHRRWVSWATRCSRRRSCARWE